MSKPSMFSKDYDKEMKKRKRRKNFFVVLLILLVGIPIVIITSMEKYVSQSGDKQNVNDKINLEQKENLEEKKEDVVNNEVENENEKEIPKTKIEEKIVKIYENKNLTIVLENKDHKKIIQNIKADENIEFFINEEGSCAIVYDKSNQDITLIDTELKLKDISRKDYVSTFNERFSKEMVMQNNEGYIWQKSPRFVDDDNIFYLSELPWINEENNLYVWIYNVKENTHMRIVDNRIVGKSIEFKEANKEGIIVKIDDKEYLINSSGQVK